MADQSLSWINVSSESDFPISSLPFGIFSTPCNSKHRIGVAIGDYLLDVSALYDAHLFDDLGFDAAVLQQETLNAFMSLPRTSWRATRNRLFDLLSDSSPDDRLRNDATLRAKALFPRSVAAMHLPATIGDYTGT
jgi:fumarylacetoacetase